MAEKEKYFEEAVKFLQRYQWIFNFQNTDLFKCEVWKRIPCEWLDVLDQLSTEELNCLPCMNEGNSHWPSSLNDFISDAQSLSIERDAAAWENAQSLTIGQAKGMNPKKKHEVEMLSSFVHNECQTHSCARILDVGSGLGYVGKVLTERFGHHVTGLERQKDLVSGADKRLRNTGQRNQLLESRTFTLQDSEDCYDEFQTLVCEIMKSRCAHIGRVNGHSSVKDEELGLNMSACGDSNTKLSGEEACARDYDPNECTAMTSCKDQDCRCGTEAESGGDGRVHCEGLRTAQDGKGRVCMMGLHCCADLTPVMLKFFIRNTNLVSLVCLGCCYHKMASKDGRWQEFPMSKKLGLVLDQSQAHCIFTQFAMRLAAQETRSRWVRQSADDHDHHTRNVAYRALLELFAKQEGICLQKRKRKVAHKSAYLNFNTYIEAVLTSFTFEGHGEDFIRGRLWELYGQYEQYFRYVELVTCLQVIVQPVLESLVIHDRVEYLREHGLQAHAVALFSQNVSPRNVAIVASKSLTVK